MIHTCFVLSNILITAKVCSFHSVSNFSKVDSRILAFNRSLCDKWNLRSNWVLFNICFLTLFFFHSSTVPANLTNATDWDILPCFHNTDSTYTRFDCYRVALLTFFGAMGPFVFFNVQKTKYLQLFTSGMRWLGE